MDFLGELAAGVLCGDGAMGTRLLAEGVAIERCFEELCVSEPDRICAIHSEYIHAGARVIETNTFGATRVRLKRFGFEHRVAEINRAAVEVARKATEGHRVFVAGSVGPLGISGKEASERGIDRAECFHEQISALLEGGVDVIFFETFMDLEEMQIAFRVKQQLSDLPEICSFACAADGRLGSGHLLPEAFAILSKQGARVMGLNCMNGPEETVRLLDNLAERFLFAVYPTAGTPETINGQLRFDVTPRQFGEATRKLIARGARLMGGCCGTTPAHIAAIASITANLPAR